MRQFALCSRRTRTVAEVLGRHVASYALRLVCRATLRRSLWRWRWYAICFIYSPWRAATPVPLEGHGTLPLEWDAAPPLE